MSLLNTLFVFLYPCVTAEVLDSKMSMYISTTPNTDGELVDLNSPLVLDDGETYYVDCVVEGAWPEPTFDATLAGTLAGITPQNQNTDFLDVTTGTLANRRSVESFTFVANHNSNCGATLTCIAGNTANQLLNSFDGSPNTMSIGVEVSVPSEYKN